MNNGKAMAIFRQIESEAYSDNEKGEAIYRVLNMETHNSITKDMCFSVIKYLFELAFDAERIEKHESD